MVYNSGQIEMKKYLIVLSTLVLFAFSSCTKIMLSGNNVTKEFSIEGSYTELCVENAFDVTVSDAVSQITVTTDENVMPKVRVEKKGETVRIYLKPLTVNAGMDLKVILPDNGELKRVELSGASKFHSSYGLMNKKIEVNLSGASDFYCDVFADEIDMNLSGASKIKSTLVAYELDLDMSGASDATLEGEVDKLDIDLSGASSIIKQVVGGCYAFACAQCEGTMSGSSEAYIHCDGNIKVELSGGSELHFTGNGNPADSSTSSGSDIIHDVNP